MDSDSNLTTITGGSSVIPKRVNLGVMWRLLPNTSMDCHHLKKKLAYKDAVKNVIKVPESWKKNEEAGADWLSSSMTRQCISILSRCTSFNKKNVGDFYDNLDSLLDIYHFMPECVCTTVHTPPKILVMTGERQVGQVTSSERGTLLTTRCRECTRKLYPASTDLSTHPLQGY